MGIKYLLDTNIVIYYLKNQLTKVVENYLDEVVFKEQPNISFISEIELMCWNDASDKDIIVLNDFIMDAQVIEIDRSIKLKTAEIRKKYKLKLPDAIIAATAISFDFTLVTRNTNDFIKIKELQVFNPWDIIEII
jgi:predicted nucleic acid-binding protein